MIGDEEEREVVDVLRSKVLARDRFDGVRKHYKVRTFEDRFRQYMGSRHALAVVNATQGLAIALSALRVGLRTPAERLLP
jgi:dTDP-4-amino-4,6-dideoxygalactose transaminase